MGISYRRLRKYLAGDPDEVSKHGSRGQFRASSLDKYYETINELAAKGVQYIEIYHVLVENGFKGGQTTLYDYCTRVFGIKCRHRNIPRRQHFIQRQEILEHIWSNKPLENYDKQWIFTLHPELFEIRDAVQEFRYAMKNMNEAELIKWVQRVNSSSIPKLRSFCNGLHRDFEAVLNSVRYPENNAVLEGNVNRLKMIKRDMFGRAGYDLLRAKVLRGIIAI